MQNALFVGRSQGFRTLHCYFQKLRQVGARVEAETKVCAFDVFHNQKDFALVFDDVVNTGDAFIVQRRNALGFLQEVTAGKLVAAQMRSQPLHRDQPLQQSIFGQIDLAHAARAQPLANFKAASQRSGELYSDSVLYPCHLRCRHISAYVEQVERSRGIWVSSW